MTPCVSIITLNFNQARTTLELLDSLSRLRTPDFDVVVVDNGSGRDDLELLRSSLPAFARLVESPRNLGFTGGNNLGIRAARGRHVLLLNNDTEVDSGFLEPLVQAIERDPDVGLASPKIRFFHSPGILQYAGGLSPSLWTARGRLIGHGEPDHGQHDVARDTELAHGAAMLIRREVIEQVGLLDDEFFIYYEELDYSARALRAGWRIRYVPESVVLHKESVTVGRESAFKSYFMTRNRALYVRRNARGLSKLAALVFFAAAALPANLFRDLLRGRRELALARLRGALWHLGLEVEAWPPADARIGRANRGLAEAA